MTELNMNETGSELSFERSNKSEHLQKFLTITILDLWAFLLVILFYTTDILLTVFMIPESFLLIFATKPIKQSALTFLISGIAFSFLEAFCVFIGVYFYTYPTIDFLIPAWLFLVWGCIGITIRRTPNPYLIWNDIKNVF